MGIYIQTPHNHGKARYIVEYLGGRVLPGAPSAEQVEAGQVPVCVVDNGPFEAAGVAFDANELAAFSRHDHRPKIWLLVPREKIIKAVGDLGTLLKF